MDHIILHNTAKKTAIKLKQEKPCFSGLDVAVIIGDKEKYLGVTGVNIVDGNFVDVPADVMAFLNMRNSGGRTAVGLAVIKLENMTFIPPSEEALELMFRANAANDGCLVCVGESESKLLSALRLGTDSKSLMEGFDGFDEPENDTVSTDTTANVISGVAVEESNPFYEKEEDLAPPEGTLSEASDEPKEDVFAAASAERELTPEELLKQAKKRKNVAKSNFLFRKKHN